MDLNNDFFQGLIVRPLECYSPQRDFRANDRVYVSNYLKN